MTDIRERKEDERWGGNQVRGGGVNDRGKRSGKFKKKIITNKTKSSRTSQKLQLLVPPLEVLYAGM
jgi:hypothetical protein